MNTATQPVPFTKFSFEHLKIPGEHVSSLQLHEQDTIESMKSSAVFAALALLLFTGVLLFAAPTKSTNANAEQARWMVSVGNWGAFSYPDSEDATRPRSTVTSFADVNGRIFMYLMGEHHANGGVTLTISEASFPPTTNFAKAACGAKGDADPEDPRCAKLSIEGRLAPCSNKLICAAGKRALFIKHPEMKKWPIDHDFEVHEFSPQDLWMIANYGGGGTIDVDDYHAAYPKHHPASAPGAIDGEIRGAIDPGVEELAFENGIDAVPDWDKKVERARWVVAHTLWTTGTYAHLVGCHLWRSNPLSFPLSMLLIFFAMALSYCSCSGSSLVSLHPLPQSMLQSNNKNKKVSTISVRLNGSAWGNIRSVIDGASFLESTGKPVFYLPRPDPTYVDVHSNPTVSLLFSEAALPDRLDRTGNACDGLDAEDPLCARVMMTGTAIKVDDSEGRLKSIEDAFKKRHPLAPWLANGGAHTGGSYFTIDPDEITLLDYYGGATAVSLVDYLKWKVPSWLTEAEADTNETEADTNERR